MKIAMISNGPGGVDDFASYNGKPHDVICGVNGIVEKIECHWWIMVDADPYFQYRPIGHPRLFISHHVPTKVRSKAGSPEFVDRAAQFQQEQYVIQEKVWRPGIARKFHRRWNSFSGTAMLGLPLFLEQETEEKIDVVDVFGVSMRGTSDQAGIDKPKCRDHQRWTDEQNIWDVLIEILNEKGIAVQRVAS